MDLRTIIPPGVTKRHLDTLVSRGSPLGISGKAVVCCLHGAVKRVAEVPYDPRAEHPHICPCCESLYAKPSDVPGLCPTCQPGGPA